MKRLGMALGLLALMAPAALACGNGKTCSPEMMKNCTPAMMKACATSASPSCAMPVAMMKGCTTSAAQSCAMPVAMNESCKVSAKFDIKGMECEDCVKKVTKELNAVKGVEAVNVDLKTGKATVDYCTGDLKDTSTLIQAVKKAGYEAKSADTAATSKK